MAHHVPVFAASELEAGQRIEGLRRRRGELQAEQRQALLAQDVAVPAREHAHAAVIDASGRMHAALAGDDELKQATAAAKQAIRRERERTRHADTIAAAIVAVEDEIKRLAGEHGDDLQAERCAAFKAQRQAVLDAAQARAAVAALHEEARMTWALWQVLGDDNRLLPDPTRIAELGRRFSELGEQAPDRLPLPRAAVAA